MESTRLNDLARKLVQRLADRCDDHSLGTVTISVYDTAWVSMISRLDNEKRLWLFPECFCFLLERQMPDGGWESYGSADDRLLNSLAGLLALKRHRNELSLAYEAEIADYEARISMARVYIQTHLQGWDVDASIHVGFEMLVPALLSMLEMESIRFDFGGRQSLEKLNAIKLKKFDPEIFYNSPGTLTHSLEAFIGLVNFDRLKDRTNFGSMMASPASTAAYLMNSTSWDLEAETYIRKVVYEGTGKGNGGVPCVFPTPIFEVTWAVSTLLRSDLETEVLGEDNLERIAVYLQNHLYNQQGLLGFAPLILPDADDTARAILLLDLLGKKTQPEAMVNHFRSKHGHFSTYPGERNSSFSANCNILKALLESPMVKDYEAEVSSITSFLCDCWWSGNVKDKWNLSMQYSMMLLSEAFVRLLELWDRGTLEKMPTGLLQDRVPIVIMQVLNRTLLSHHDIDTWKPDGYPEAIAYSILTLSEIARVADIVDLHDEVAHAIQLGQDRLIQLRDDWTKDQYLWIEKVTFGCHILSEAYCLAALKLRPKSYVWSDLVRNIFDVRKTTILEHAHFLASIKAFQNNPLWEIKAIVVEAHIFIPQLRSARLDILPRQKEAKDAYLDLIPCTWIIVNYYDSLFLSANMLWDMMVLTVCNFRVDEFMETTGAKLIGQNLEEARSTVNELCSAEDLNKLGMTHQSPEDLVEPHNAQQYQFTIDRDKTETALTPLERDRTSDAITTTDFKNPVSSFSKFRAIMTHYIEAMLCYPRIQHASSLDLSNLRYQIRGFLLAHLDQISDNSRFTSQITSKRSSPGIFPTFRTPFYAWAHTTGADSVSCPFSFAFFTCLLGSASVSKHNHQADVFSTVRQNYFAQELCARLAVMSRLYNDFGSTTRDRAEANINSINFPEFYRHAGGSVKEQSTLEWEGILKGELLKLAEDERRCVDLALESLLVEMGAKQGRFRLENEKRKGDALRLFVGVTKLYADMYVARDLSNPIERA